MIMSAVEINREKHPCFNVGVKGRFGRVHLPIAPKCNIRCNYCNRKYDCVNESRPGVTSTILSPEQAVKYIEKVLVKEPRISVAGIAGPGDPFANPAETMETLRRIRMNYPELILCLASNGMSIGPYIDELSELQVSHVTITVNAVDPQVGARVYSWMRDNKVVYRGIKGATVLLEKQIAAIAALKKNGITVKINTVVIPGVNDHHVIDIARKMKELGVDLLNCMAMFPNADTPFADITQPSKETIATIRREAEEYLPQMRHCTRCRADAVGLLEDDITSEIRSCLSACATLLGFNEKERPYVAVATNEGILVNLHLGEADCFQIWTQDKNGFRMIGHRQAPKPGNGMRRWIKLAKLLDDCRAVLVSGIGKTPFDIISRAGIKPVEMSGFIEAGLDAIYNNHPLTSLKGRKVSCEGGCSADGSGCI